MNLAEKIPKLRAMLEHIRAFPSSIRNKSNGKINQACEAADASREKSSGFWHDSKSPLLWCEIPVDVFEKPVQLSAPRSNAIFG